jgi:signal transduction histidine kinase
MGYSEFIIKISYMPKEELDKYLETIRSNSIRANTLIQDLFEYSRLEIIDFKLSFKSMDINEFLKNIIASYVPQFESKSINYDFDIPEEKTYIAFDEKQLDRAISNLILNSIKYNPSGTTTKIKAGVVNNCFNIVLEDDGVGIPVELKQDIFQAFVQADTSRNSQTRGTGLGRAITKKIIDKHGGSISLESDTNKGSKFVIKLPL